MEQMREFLGKLCIVVFNKDPYLTQAGRLMKLSSMGEATLLDEDSGDVFYIWPALQIIGFEDVSS